jgi:hypothetical protein
VLAPWQQLCRLLARGKALQQVLLGVCLLLGMFCLFAGVFVTIGTLEHSAFIWVWAGIGLLLAGVLIMELLRRLEKPLDTTNGDNYPKAPGFRAIETAIASFFLQIQLILLFALLLDGGVRLRACLYSYVGYLAGLVLIFARRARALTNGDVLYLRWGWLPIIVLGVALFLRVWKAKGLI